jgi:PAS domain-containing protein
VAHVELSVSEPLAGPDRDAPSDPEGSLSRWGRVVTEAGEPCLVLDGVFEIVAVSPTASRLLGFPDEESAVGRRLSEGVIPLVDFTSPPVPLPESDLEKIPPRLAYSSGRLARGLLRVQTSTEVRTIDAVATPLFDGDKPIGSLTFFSQI